jgi:hypothetical protein
MRDITKKRIISIVKEYKRFFPRQYKMAAEANKQRAQGQVSDWGETLGTSDIIHREELRMPTDLHTILYTKLLPEEQVEFESDKGILWFQKTFPEWVPNRKLG